jgi:hypothetical protein
MALRPPSSFREHAVLLRRAPIGIGQEGEVEPLLFVKLRLRFDRIQADAVDLDAELLE